MIFKTKDDKRIENVSEYVKNWIDKHPDSEIFIGCDSQVFNEDMVYVTSICLYENKKGGHIISSKERVNKMHSNTMHVRLWGEVERAVKAAQDLNIPDKKITIHVDYNSDHHHKSNNLYEAGIGYAKSFGYEAVGKPNAWAASTVADRGCR